MLKILQHQASRVARSLQRSRQAAAFRQTVSSLHQPLKLHLACGNVRLQGWVNVDGLSTTTGHDVIWDLRDPLPLPDSSVAYIFNEHFLEHLNVSDGVKFLRECHRLLQPGGVLRVAMPDLKTLVGHYVEGNWKEQPWLKQYHFDWIQTGAEYLNICMREWEHLWVYDLEELKRRLAEAGFQNTLACQNSQSQHPDLQNLETRAESMLIVEATKN